MKEIDVSIIIPIYNGEKYIEKLIENISSLNNDINFEIILINDKSTDNSLKICQGFSTNNKNITVINNDTNQGIAESRNNGLKHANGKYITFVDQDDSLIKGYSSFIKEITNNKCDFICTNYKTKTNVMNEIIINNKSTICNKEEITKLERYMFDPNIFPVDKPISIKSSVWNCIFDASFIKNNNIHFFRYTSYEDDWLFIIECLKHANKVFLCNDSYYCWTISDTSESHKNKYIEDYFKKSLALLDYAINSLKNTGLTDDDLKEYLYRCNSNILLWNIYNEMESKNSIKNNVNISKLLAYYKKDINVFIQKANLYNKIIFILLKINALPLIRFIQRKIVKKKYV